MLCTYGVPAFVPFLALFMPSCLRVCCSDCCGKHIPSLMQMLFQAHLTKGFSYSGLILQCALQHYDCYPSIDRVQYSHSCVYHSPNTTLPQTSKTGRRAGRRQERTRAGWEDTGLGGRKPVMLSSRHMQASLTWSYPTVAPMRRLLPKARLRQSCFYRGEIQVQTVCLVTKDALGKCDRDNTRNSIEIYPLGNDLSTVSLENSPFVYTISNSHKTA